MLISWGLEWDGGVAVVVERTLCGERDTAVSPAKARVVLVVRLAGKSARPTQTFRLSRRDAAHQILLLRLAFGADGEGVKDAQRKSVFDGFILTLS
jgi:hypothetical protein